MPQSHVWMQLEERSEAVEEISIALQAALEAADPVHAMSRIIRKRRNTLVVGNRSFDLDRFGRVLVIGAGKASAKMALGLESRILEDITVGLIISPEGQVKPSCKKVLILDAPHPIPGKKSVEATRRMLSLVGEPKENDLIICLFSGGASALMEVPVAGVTLGQLKYVTKLLLRSGAGIQEINTVRKHLSQVKGGRLAEKLFPATVLTFLISDVVGDRVDTIASGPTTYDATTFKDARTVLERRGIWQKIHVDVRHVINDGVGGLLKETPKKGSPVFAKTALEIVGTNRASCRAAADVLRARGYQTKIMSTSLEGEARQVGTRFVRRLRRDSRDFHRRFALVGGGETTVSVMGKGRGGRNQELALAALIAMGGRRHVWLAAMGTDGIDGMTDAAGAIANGGMLEVGMKLGLNPNEFLNDNDSYKFFKAVGGLIITGQTGTNVNDIIVGLSSRVE
jgi:glycerate 2-kinase